MKLFRKSDREPVNDEGFAQRLGAITGRTRQASDPYRQDTPSVAA